MASSTVAATSLTPPPGLPSSSCELLWYAVYTSANHEKRVANQLAERSVEHFLPLYESIRRWKDRRVRLQLPLFPGYIFVRLVLRDRLRVLQVPGVTRLVGFGGIPVPLLKEEIDSLRGTLASGLQAQPHPYMTVGGRVKVKSGPLAGTEGIFQRRKGKVRLIISIELIQRSLAVDLDLADVELAETGETGSIIGASGRTRQAPYRQAPLLS